MMNTDLLADLHRQLAERLGAMLQKDEVQAAVLREAREFLRDNGISVKAGTQAAAPAEGLLDELEEHERHPFEVLPRTGTD